jgi:O-antigen ligase
MLSIGKSMSDLSNPLRAPLRTRSHWLKPSRLVGMCVLFFLGMMVIFIVGEASKLETRGIQLVASAGFLKIFCILAVGSLLTVLLIRYAEVALGLFFLVGLVKGDPTLSSSPVDLTVLIGVLVLVGVCYRLFVNKEKLHLPVEYVFYTPLLAMMIVSLTYTPDLAGGLEKLLRFVCLTGIGIIAPFVLFDEFRKINRFFIVLILGGVGLAVNSLTMLGGEERMVSPSGLNTELGAACAIALILIWGLLFPRMSLVKRMFFYPVLGLLGIALIGSGGRFANVSAVICILLGTFFCRKLFADILIAGGAGIVALPFLWIPQASFDYLHSLLRPSQAMGTRNDLMWLGVRMFSEHPLLGVGAQGFRYFSPNPLTYNYPHNLILELGSEMGVVAAVSFLAIAFCAFREIIRQLWDPFLRTNPLVTTILLLLIYVFLDAMVSGDINDLRFMWFVFGLPFVLRNLASTLPVLTMQQVTRRVPAAATTEATV